MKIRPAKDSDATDITKISAVLGYPVSEKIVKENLIRILPKENHFILVAVENDKVQGFIEAETYEAVYSEGTMFNVLGLAVDESFQDEGIGGKLLAALEEEGKKRGYIAIRLSSGEQRHLAHEFYEKHGYSCNHMQKRFLKELEQTK